MKGMYSRLAILALYEGVIQSDFGGVRFAER